jgi:Na+/proline symporter
MAWCLTGLAAVAYFAGSEIHPDQIYGKIARDFLPAILPGLLGLFIATLLASVMSSCDSFMIASSALFTENLYKRVFSDRSQGHYILVGRITGFFVVVGGVVFAFWLPNVIRGLEIFWKIPPMMGIAFWLGLFWRRGTKAGAWAATLLGFGALFLSEQSFFVSLLESLPRLFDLPWVVESHDAKAMYLPWQMVFYLSIGTAGAIIVSLLTRPSSEEKLERFYALTRTPVSPGEQIEEPCTLPDGAKTSPSRRLFPFFNLEIQIPSIHSMIGFSVGWVLVLGLILFFLAVTGTI